MGIGKVIALDDLLDNARRRVIRLELSAIGDDSNLTNRANIELLSNQLEAAQRLLREISEPDALAM
jgi:Flp pilus assembly protein TadD